MNRPEIRLGPGECSDVETGARFFTALAFPTEAQDERRATTTKAMVGLYVHEAQQLDWASEALADPRLHQFSGLDRRWCREQFKFVKKRLEARSEAARAVRPIVRQIFGHEARPIEGSLKFSPRQIHLHLHDNDEESAENFRTRKAVPTRSVLHLAVAQDIWLAANVTDRQTDIGIASLEIYRTLVAWAAFLEPRLLADKRLRLKEQDILRLRWVN